MKKWTTAGTTQRSPRKSAFSLCKSAICTSVASAYVLFSPINAFAQDRSEKDSFISIRGSLTSEFNLLNSGNAVIFSPVGTTGTTYPAKEMVGPANRKTAFWRNNLQLYFTHEYAEFWMGVYANSDDFNWPDSVGLEATLLFPVYFLTERLKIGFYHNSAHNLVEERYGKGIDVTGIHFCFDFADVSQNSEWFLDMWMTYSLIADKASPFIFTKNAQEMPKKDLGRLRWATGLQAGNENSRYNSELTVSFNASNDGLASMRTRLKALYKIQNNIAIGPFAEYNFNLRKADKFGRDEWLIGPVTEFTF